MSPIEKKLEYLKIIIEGTESYIESLAKLIEVSEGTKDRKLAFELSPCY
jgi:hypothetical protein